MIWSNNHIGHNTYIGQHTYISSNVTLSGHCKIGERCFFGVNSCVSDFVKLEMIVLLQWGQSLILI